MADRPLHRIADDITRSWGARINFAAKPYVSAMRYLGSIEDTYGPASESASEIVNRFLGNAGTWRGADAKRIKAELREMLK